MSTRFVVLAVVCQIGVVGQSLAQAVDRDFISQSGVSSSVVYSITPVPENPYCNSLQINVTKSNNSVEAQSTLPHDSDGRPLILLSNTVKDNLYRVCLKRRYYLDNNIPKLLAGQQDIKWSRNNGKGADTLNAGHCAFFEASRLEMKIINKSCVVSNQNKECWDEFSICKIPD